MDEEIKAIEKNDTWKLTTLSNGHKSIGVKWVYKKKKNFKRHMQKDKIRLMVKSYKQQASIDYGEVFISITHMKIIRLLIFIVTQ